MTILAAIIRQLGMAGCITLGLLAFYEGIPGAAGIPWLAGVPIVGELTTGRVHAYAADQVRLATAELVSIAERDALVAQLALERKRAMAAAQSFDELTNRLEAQHAANDALSKKLEDAIAADRGDDGCTWSNGDLEWLRQH
ncbi:hypothetical protein MRS76_20280 [Rhizobiaceae bacterium n13]|uniref:hypothetical protein n=1 Tax=Ferirhizobium litorale TaxID=2927786 RepID=UPI0024B30B3C|nr:hypothetical protein [Fererhizobium litorale]MDI7864280.1 hypothetical protein [Fererhizobium litorale]